MTSGRPKLTTILLEIGKPNSYFSNVGSNPASKNQQRSNETMPNDSKILQGYHQWDYPNENNHFSDGIPQNIIQVDKGKS